MDGDDVCVSLHTALRKCCDSKATTAAYNLIHLIQDKPGHVNPWRVLGDLVATQTPGSSPASVVLRKTVTVQPGEFESLWVQAWSKREFETMKNERLSDTGRDLLHWTKSLSAIFELFNENDWKGMAAYLA